MRESRSAAAIVLMWIKTRALITLKRFITYSVTCDTVTACNNTVMLVLVGKSRKYGIHSVSLLYMVLTFPAWSFSVISAKGSSKSHSSTS